MAAPYGTRSRNRTGNARINYAEDKDIEMDNYDYYHSKTNPDGSGKKPSRQSTAAANGDGPLRGSGSRKLGLDDGKSAGSSQNGSREQSSSNGGGGGGGGSSTAASQPAQASVALQPSSRKRKATTTQSATASSMSSPAVMSTKRIGNAMQVTGPPLRETNLMTFEHSNARPENGRMKADDGTVLEPNGESSKASPPPQSSPSGSAKGTHPLFWSLGGSPTIRPRPISGMAMACWQIGDGLALLRRVPSGGSCCAC